MIPPPPKIAAPPAQRRSRLFRSRPDALLVEEWVPNITLPPPPDAPLDDEDPAEARLDEHGLPDFQDEPDEDREVRAGPVRLFVGLGQRGASVAPPPDGDEGGEDVYEVNEPADYFVAELRLPRPEDSLPFRLTGVNDQDDEEEDEEFLLDADEASDPAMFFPGLDTPFTVSLEPPDPLHLSSLSDDDDDLESEDDAFEYQAAEDGLDGEDDLDGEEHTWDDSWPSADDSMGMLGDEPVQDDADLDAVVSGGIPPLTLRPSVAREPLRLRHGAREEPAAPPPPLPPAPQPEPQPEPEPPPRTWSRPGGPAAPPPEPPQPQRAPSSGKAPVQVLRSRPSWTRDRMIKEASPAPAPLFQPRPAPPPSPVRERLFNPATLGLLLALMIIAAAVAVLFQWGPG